MSSQKLELEKQIEDKYITLTDKEKQDYYKKEKQLTILVYVCCSLFSAAISMFFVAMMGNGEALTIVAIVLFAVLSIVFIIMMIIELRKPQQYFIKRYLKRLLTTNDNVQSFYDFLEEQGFKLSKEIAFATASWTKSKLLIDNDNKLFIYQHGKNMSNIYSFNDIINYEVYENGSSKVKGTAGKALVGGAFFGLGGMILGSNMGRNVSEKCSQLQLIIRLNDANNPQILIDYINNVSYDKVGSVYTNIRSNLQYVCSQLEYMINTKTIEEQVKQKSSTKTIDKKQLKDLKELYEEGIITQEEFELKKREILGIR